jgi:hypothetical protein
MGPQGRAPDGRVQLVARDDPAPVADQRHQQLELPHRQRQRPSFDLGEVIGGPDLQISGSQHLGLARQLHRDDRLSLSVAPPVIAR